MKRRYRILVLYWNHESLDRMRVGVRQHLGALEASDRGHELFYYNTFQYGPPPELRDLHFDAVVFHNLFLCMRWTPFFYHWKRGLEWIADLRCAKIAMPQDEYDHAEILDEWLYDLGVETIVSNFRQPAELKLLYPIMHTRARFEVGLTGYLDDRLVNHYADRVLPIKDRPLDVAYRAKHLPYWFGSHGQIKWQVGERVDRQARAKGMRSNISSAPQDTILGNKWLDFLASSRAITGCEGGSSVIDRRGEFQSQIEEMLRRQPGMTFEQVSRFMPPGWDDTVLPLTGPRHLEAVMTRTCQILVEGNFCGVLQAERHFIPIRRDYSNLDEVLERLRDYDAVQKMVDFAFEDICLSGRYSSKVLAQTLERAIDETRYPVEPMTRFAIQPRWDACLADPRADERVSLEISDEELAALGEPFMPEPQGQRALEEAPPPSPQPPPRVGTGRARTAAASAGPLDFADAFVVLSTGSDSPWTSLIPHLSAWLPVYVVEPGAPDPGTQRGPCTSIAVGYHATSDEINAALCGAGVRRPILITDQRRFTDLLASRGSAFSICWLTEQLAGELSTLQQDVAVEFLRTADLVLCGVEPPPALLTGIPIEPFMPQADLSAAVQVAQFALCRGDSEMIVAVRGIIDERLNVALLDQLARQQPAWTIWIAGPVRVEPAGWGALLALPNLRYLAVDDEVWSWYAPRATVALLPYSARFDSLLTDALLLLGAGVPVVTTFAPWPRLEGAIRLASDDLTAQLSEAAASRFETAQIGARRALACAYDRGTLLHALPDRIREVREASRPHLGSSRLSIASIGEDSNDVVWALLSHHQVKTIAASDLEAELAEFDAVMLFAEGVAEPSAADRWRPRLERFGGLKIAICRRALDAALEGWLAQVGFHALMAPVEALDRLSNRPLFDLLPISGDVAAGALTALSAPPLRQRPITLATHPAFAPAALGAVGNLHFLLNRIDSACARRHLQTAFDARGADLDPHSTLKAARALLVPHTHAELLDARGNLRAEIRQAIDGPHKMSYDAAAAAFLAAATRYAQRHVVPKLLEALALGTAIVTVEGSIFTPLLEPGRHCLELRRDLANLEEVLDLLGDDIFVTELVARAYREVGRGATMSGLIETLDDYASRAIRRPRPRRRGASDERPLGISNHERKLKR